MLLRSIRGILAGSAMGANGVTDVTANPRILALSGSLRESSYNQQVVNIAAAGARKEANSVRFMIFIIRTALSCCLVRVRTVLAFLAEWATSRVFMTSAVVNPVFPATAAALNGIAAKPKPKPSTKASPAMTKPPAA